MKFIFTKDYIVSFLVVLLAFAFIRFFTDLFIYMLVAAIIGLVTRPLKELIMKIKLFNRHPGNGSASVLTMLILIAMAVAVLTLIVPTIVAQTNDLHSLNYQQISDNLHSSAIKLENGLKTMGIIDDNETLTEVFLVYLKDFVAHISFNKMAGNAISVLGSLFMALFSILFFSFFFINDSMLFHKIVLLFVPQSKQEAFSNILIKIRQMLSRYFIGLMTEIASMMLLISLGGLILGLKNALLIGFLGGLMNIIPYIGPLIGASIGGILVTISHINSGLDETLPLVYGILGVFLVANLIDNFLLQPLIYSNSVKAHPMEIFIVILIAGSLAGPTGMIVAIPLYTILRIMAREFFQDQPFIQQVTKDL